MERCLSISRSRRMFDEASDGIPGGVARLGGGSGVSMLYRLGWIQEGRRKDTSESKPQHLHCPVSVSPINGSDFAPEVSSSASSASEFSASGSLLTLPIASARPEIFSTT